jgi:hypothetical protein
MYSAVRQLTRQWYTHGVYYNGKCISWYCNALHATCMYTRVLFAWILNAPHPLLSLSVCARACASLSVHAEIPAEDEGGFRQRGRRSMKSNPNQDRTKQNRRLVQHASLVCATCSSFSTGGARACYNKVPCIKQNSKRR